MVVPLDPEPAGKQYPRSTRATGPRATIEFDHLCGACHYPWLEREPPDAPGRVTPGDSSCVGPPSRYPWPGCAAEALFSRRSTRCFDRRSRPRDERVAAIHDAAVNGALVQRPRIISVDPNAWSNRADLTWSPHCRRRAGMMTREQDASSRRDPRGDLLARGRASARPAVRRPGVHACKPDPAEPLERHPGRLRRLSMRP